MHTDGQEVLSALKMIKQVKQREGRVWDLVERRTCHSPSQFRAEELTGAKALGGDHVCTQEKARKPVGPEGSEVCHWIGCGL